MHGRASSLGLALVGLWTLLAPAGVAVGQQQAPARDCSPLAPFDLDFAGGTLKEYIAAIQEAQPCANIMLEQYDWKAPIPPVTLHNVPALVAMNLVARNREEGGIRVVPIEDDAGQTRAIRVASYESTFRNLGESRAPEPDRIPAVFNLAEPLALGRGADELLGAIETGLSVFDGPAATIKFHEPTGLLIVRGAEEQISVVSRVVDELRGSSQLVASRERNLRETLASLRFDVMEAQAEREYAGEKLIAYRDAVKLARQRVEAGAQSPENLRVAELSVAEAERDFRIAEARLMQASERMERIEAELARITGEDGDDAPQDDG